MTGDGKYGELSTAAAQMLQADAVMLVVINGVLGTGMNFSVRDPKLIRILPQVLRDTADALERSEEIEQDVNTGEKLKEQGGG